MSNCGGRVVSSPPGGGGRVIIISFDVSGGWMGGANTLCHHLHTPRSSNISSTPFSFTCWYLGSFFARSRASRGGALFCTLSGFLRQHFHAAGGTLQLRLARPKRWRGQVQQGDILKGLKWGRKVADTKRAGLTTCGVATTM